jgi:hypothetical protein
VSELRTCKVSYLDSEGIEHAVQVTAETLFEAAALALVAFRNADLLASGAPGQASRLTIRVSAPVATHTVSMQRLAAWLGGAGRTPKEQALKARLNDLLQGE